MYLTLFFFLVIFYVFPKLTYYSFIKATEITVVWEKERQKEICCDPDVS